MADTCKHLKEIFKAEEPFLNQEYTLHKWFSSEKNHKEIGLEEAILDYVRTHFISWATGFAWAYCPLYCEGEGCEGYVAKQTKFNLGIKDIQDEKGISFEEAEKIYISNLGPSFWKGVTDAMIYIKNKKKITPESP